MSEDASTLKRVKLPDTRTGATRKATIGNWELYVVVNYFENDQPGEVFVTVGKSGSTISGLVQTIATQMSMLLQVGVPVSKVCEKMRHHKFEPCDTNFDSIVDAIAKTVLDLCSDRGSLADMDNEKKAVKW